MVTPVAGETHHIVLSDGTTQLGLLSADEMRSFLRIPVARSSLKTAQGDTLYSDLEPPYNTTAQKEFHGGRAQRDFRVDPTKFYDSWNVDTRFQGQCTLGPKITVGTQAASVVPEYAPGVVADTTVLYHKILQETIGSASGKMYLEGSTQWKACQSFVAPSGGGSIASADVYIYSVAASCTVTVEIQSDNGSGLPSGTVLATVGIASVATTGWKTATFASPLSVTGGTTYWLVFYTTATTVTTTRLTNTSAYADGRSGYFDGTYHLNAAQWDHAFRVMFTQIKRSQSFNYAGSGSYTVQYIWLYLKKVGTVTPTVRIETDSSGVPSGTLAHANATATLVTTDVGTSYGWTLVQYTDFNLTKGTTYHIVVYDDTQRDQNSALYWGNDGAASYTGGAACSKVGAAAWAADTARDFYFRINDGQGMTQPPYKIFPYKGQIYMVTSPVEGTAAGHLWMNGDRGACDSNAGALTTLVDATKTWTTDEWAGCVVKIIAGAGKGEYRTIVSNTATALTLSEAWTTTHTTDSQYVILGSAKWTDVSPASGDLIDAAITDVLVANGIMYIAQGDGQNILRYREYDNSGTWTKENADDGTNKAVVMLEHKNYIWRGFNTNQVAAAPVVAWGTNLTFATAINVGTSDYQITSLLIYDSDLWVGKEDSLWSVKANVPEQIPVDFSSLAGEENCRRMKKFNVYLFFPVQYGLERLYGLQVDDMGPNRGEGLPSGRQGPIADILPMPGLLYVAIDGGASGTSSILVYNELGWHEFVRATSSGARIRGMGVQVIPGGPNRLWFGMGNDIAYVPIPAQSVNPIHDTAINYAASGELVTSWIDLHLTEVEKYFDNVKVVSENLSAGITISAYYQKDDSDDADAWTLIGTVNTSPAQELAIGQTGRRIRFKFTLTTNSTTVTPNLVAFTLDSLARLTPKSRFEPLVRLEDFATMLNGAPDDNSRDDIIDQLDAWAGEATPLTMTTCDPAFTDLTVWLEPLPETQKHYEAQAQGGDMRGGQGRLILMEA
jgi:hypothetical protein